MMIVVSRPPVSAAEELLYPHTGCWCCIWGVVLAFSNLSSSVTMPAAM